MLKVVKKYFQCNKIILYRKYHIYKATVTPLLLSASNLLGMCTPQQWILFNLSQLGLCNWMTNQVYISQNTGHTDRFTPLLHVHKFTLCVQQWNATTVQSDYPTFSYLTFHFILMCCVGMLSFIDGHLSM
jgi:hypothetical protein